MPYSKRLVLQEHCCFSPVCLSPSREDADLIVSSQKLADRSGLDSITVLFVLNENILHETLVRLPLDRVKVPARLLHTPASITVHLAICDAKGVADVLDSGQLLVLPPGPAKELQQVYHQMTLDVQDSFYSPYTSEVADSGRPRQQPAVWSHLLPEPSRPAAAAASPTAASPISPDSSVHSVRSVSSSQESRRAACYAYQHLLLPVVHLMSAVLQGSAAHKEGSASPRETAALQSIARRLLDFLVDNDMFESATFFMGQLPFAPEHAMGPRSQLLNSLAAGSSSVRALVLQHPLQQQLLTLQIAHQHTAETLRELQRRSRMFPVLDLQEQQQQQQQTTSTAAAAASKDGRLLLLQQQSSGASSMASAEEILRQLGVLEHVRGEQEALESELLLQEEQEALESELMVQQQQQQCVPQQLVAAAAAGDQTPLHRCSSVPWSFHSMLKDPGQGLVAIGSSDEALEGLGLPTSDLLGLGLGGQQQQQRRSRAIPDDLEGYLQPPPSFLRRSLPQPTAAAAAAATGGGRGGGGVSLWSSQEFLGEQTAATRGASLDLHQHQQHRSGLVPVLSAAPAESAVTAQQQQQEEGHCPEAGALSSAGSLSPTATAYDQQLLRVPVPLQQQLPAFASLDMPSGLQKQQQHPALLGLVQQQQQQQQLHAPQAVSAALPQQWQQLPAAMSGPGPTMAAALSSGRFHSELTSQKLQGDAQTQKDMNNCSPAAAADASGGSRGLDLVSPAAAAGGEAAGGCGLNEQRDIQLMEARVDSELRQRHAALCGCGCRKASSSSSSSTSSTLTVSECKAAALAHWELQQQQQQTLGGSSSKGQVDGKPNRQQQQHVDSAVSGQHLSGLIRTSITGGFADEHVEKAYLMFKNHSCALLDTTAAVMCLGMLLASTWRSFNPRHDPLAWQKLAVLGLFSVFFFLPYAVMQAKQQLFLRWREPLIVLARVGSSCVQVLIGLGIIAQPDAWVAVVGMFVALQLQDGFILPSCQQVRMPAAVAVAAAQLVADACMLQIAYSPWVALLQAVVIQMCSLLVGLWLDAWGRKRFMLRFRGMFG